MGKLDDMTKELYEDNLVFADTMNVLFFDGEPVIQAQNLSPLDATEEHTIFRDGTADEGADKIKQRSSIDQEGQEQEFQTSASNERQGNHSRTFSNNERQGNQSQTFSNNERQRNHSRTFSNQKYRDVLRLLQTQHGSLEVRIIVGAELQSHIHYAMPIRNFEYDALNLSRQLSARQKYNRENHLLKSKNEFLSGIKKGETFTPVLTVVVYLGKELWDAPETLHEMLNLEGVPEELLAYVPDYRTAILQPGSVTSEQLARMKSPLRHILGVIRASSSWQDMNNYVEQNKTDLSHLDSLTAGIISEACNMNIPKQELEKEDVDMCEALVQLKEIGRQEGLSEGETKGKIEGKAIAYLECGKSDEWIMNHLQISQEKLDEIRSNQ